MSETPYHFPPAMAVPKRPRRWPIVLAIVVLFGLLGAQTLWLYRLSDQLSRTSAQADADRRAASDAVVAVASTVAQLQEATLQADRIAADALPSVFRVKAGRATGTAWAVGAPKSGGGTNLFTNFHVVESVWKAGERTVNIEHDQQLYRATIARVDEELDVAHLEADGKFPGLAVSATEVRPGQPIIVVGAPLGLESSVTTGVVSALRKLEGGDQVFVQFDAPINPGNSGGPVINAQGQVVGIATAKIRNAEGIGFAIPIDHACNLFSICS